VVSAPEVTYRCAAIPPVAAFLVIFPGFAPYPHVPVPEAPESPKSQVYATSWKAVILPLIDESVEPVASKKTKSGDMPEA
jgi:hypothetical protein